MQRDVTSPSSNKERAGEACGARKACRGRPREFDAEQALDRAMTVFWKNGYEGTSLPDLTRAMGISRPSLYAAFGNKEQLFRKALDRYTEGATALLKESVAQPTSRAAVEHLMRAALGGVARCKSPGGCFLVQSALACGEGSAAVQKDVAARRKMTETVLRKRFEQGARDRDLPAGTKPAELAAYFAAVMQGIALQSAGGTSKESLQRVVDLALKIWYAPA